ncbi:uncharacterized protein T551_00407 [Pneumocystis jirovecii RU7]|uniref:Ubiquitin carboxyl-terminal hydrolase n=1 Tax=Pneumocystis jirovecii (strain RU7) TaxID=1408657 RepID=A0A0W4ZVC9_PNEJ7|nr:uncharacterized protein T551_00407 [Pneumocystis jirovecii RU7]KTW32316.1 hypothetical protein T551_00407 [Pneumocystis jirovecii RU7]
MTEKKSSWIPIECNPSILTEYLWELGINKNLGFHDVYSLDNEDILSVIPRPVYSLLFVFPMIISNEDKDFKKSGATLIKNDQNILWYKQTIKNSCGTIALLHASTNGGARDFILPDSLLQNILNETENLNIDSRSKFIESFSQLKIIHTSKNNIFAFYNFSKVEFASQGKTSPNLYENTIFHYICFVKSSKNGHLYELDGRNPLGPIDHGILNEDLLGNQTIQIIKKYIYERKKDIQFSLCALAPVFH